MTSLALGLFGGSYRLSGLTPEQTAVVQSRFGPLLSPDDGQADVSIDVHFSPNRAAFMPRPPGPQEYRVAVAHRADHIAAAGIGFTANVDRAPLRAQIHTCLDDAWFLGAFENVLRIVAAYRLFDSGALLMHSAAFTDGTRGFLFCGRSGAGKTTLCDLADQLELRVLSDELNAVADLGDRFELRAMPFAGDFGGAVARHPPYPLTGLLGLAHDTAPRVDSCSRAQAVGRIVAACPYLNSDPRLVDELTSRVARLVERIPLRILSFAKDTRFWGVLDREYGSQQPSLSR